MTQLSLFPRAEFVFGGRSRMAFHGGKAWKIGQGPSLGVGVMPHLYGVKDPVLFSLRQIRHGVVKVYLGTAPPELGMKQGR